MAVMKKRIDVAALGLHVTGASAHEARCLCPFHADHTPSASINLQTGLFHCFACGHSANAQQLAKALGGAVVWTTAALRIQPHGNDEFEWALAGKLALDNPYLKRRRVDSSLIERFKIRDVHDGVAFALNDMRGQTVGVLVRRTSNIRPRYLFFGRRTPGWPMEILATTRPRDRLVLVEGVFGVLRALSAGVTAFATLSASGPRTTYDAVRGFHNRVVLFDDDFAGHVGAIRHIIEGAAAYMPGAEADELEPEQWQNLDSFLTLTRSVRDVLDAEPDDSICTVCRRIMQQTTRDVPPRPRRASLGHSTERDIKSYV